MEPLAHQVIAAKQLKKKLYRYNLAILSGEPRSGKTISFLSVLKDYKSPLIITQKAAITDIKSQAEALGVNCEVVNFHSVKKCVSNYDIIVVDECFVPGTLVDGTPIEELQVGDIIRSFNEITNTVELKPITTVFKKKLTEKLVKVKVGETVIQCTESHLFLTKGAGWVKAKDLTNEMFIMRVPSN